MEEDELYEKVCKGRFDCLEKKFDASMKKIDAIHIHIVGDKNSNGLSGRLIVVEQTIEVHKGRWKWGFGIFAAVVGKLIYDIVSAL